MTTDPGPIKTQCFLAVETYDDGCQKSKWFNFHENGHQHICVCGKYDPHQESLEFERKMLCAQLDLAAAQKKIESMEETNAKILHHLGPSCRIALGLQLRADGETEPPTGAGGIAGWNVRREGS